MRSARQPAHQPAPPFVAPEFPFDRFRIRAAIFPQPAVDQTHEMRILRAAPAGLMRRDENLRATQRCQADILDKVAIITNQHPRPKPLRKVEHSVIRAVENRLVFKRMQFAMALCAPVGRRHDIGVVEFSACASLH